MTMNTGWRGPLGAAAALLMPLLAIALPGTPAEAG